MERWKIIEGFENYQVSDHGRVRSLKKGTILKASKGGIGYLKINLYKGKTQKTTAIHRLVAKAFVKGYFEGACVDHLNGVKTDNRSTNLQWTTQRENVTRGEVCKRNPNNSSRYPGVYRHKKTKKWIPRIFYKGKRHSLGCFNDETQAAQVYEEALQTLKENRFSDFLTSLRS